MAACGIHHRPYMGSRCVSNTTTPSRVCHVPTLSLAAYNSRSPEPGRAADRTLKVQAKLLLGLPGSGVPAGARSTVDKGTKGVTRRVSPRSTPYEYECYEDSSWRSW